MRLPGWLMGRSPRATLRIETKDEPPSAENAGGGVLVTLTLTPEETFVVKRSLLELVLSTTHFSRTVLDGYREHTTEEAWQTIELCRNVQARPGETLAYSATLRIPELPASCSIPVIPVRRQWRVQARIESQGRRGFSAAVGLRNVNPPHGGAPTVDGAGFLPLYEFRSGSSP